MARAALACVALVALAGCAGGPTADATATPSHSPTHTVPDCGLGTGGVAQVSETDHRVENATMARKLAEQVANGSVTVTDRSPVGHADDVRDHIDRQGGNASRLFFADVGETQEAIAVTGTGDVYRVFLGAC